MASHNPPRQVSFTVGTTNVKIAEECFQERTKFNIVNTSTGGQVVSLDIGQEAVNGVGIVLYPGGSYGESKNDKSDEIAQNQLNAIADASGATIGVMERVVTRGRDL